MKIAVDIDEVLAEFILSFIDYLDKHHQIKLEKKHFTTFDLWKVLNISKEEINNMFSHYESLGENMKIKVIPGAIPAIQELAQQHELYIITARPLFIEKETREWIKIHFQDSFKDIHFIGTKHLETNGTKANICKKLNIPLIIEDSLTNATQCAQENIQAILLDQPWNQTKTLHKNIIRVHNWQEIIQTIDKLTT